MSTERVRAIGDAAIAVLADGGSRSLTHRAVDERAGLPKGATSNVARTRAALLELTVVRLAELDLAAFGAVTPHSADDLAQALAVATQAVLTTRRSQTIARYELTLESTRRPELRAHLAREGDVLRAASREVLVALGSTAPDRHTRQLLALLEGLVFTTSIDGQPSPGRAELALMFTDLLAGQSLA